MDPVGVKGGRGQGLLAKFMASIVYDVEGFQKFQRFQDVRFFLNSRFRGSKSSRHVGTYLSLSLGQKGAQGSIFPRLTGFQGLNVSRVPKIQGLQGFKGQRVSPY